MNPRPSDFLISENGRQTLYSFGHPDWYKQEKVSQLPIFDAEKHKYWCVRAPLAVVGEND